MNPTATANARRALFLTTLAALLGLVAGGAAWVLVPLTAVIPNLALLHRWGWDLASLQNYQPNASLLLVAVLGGLVVSLIAKWSPVIRGHGIPEAMEAVLSRQ